MPAVVAGMPVIGAGMPVPAPVAASVPSSVARTVEPPAIAMGIACTAAIVTHPGIMRTAAAEVAAARGMTATRVVTPASARGVTAAAATPTVTAPAAATPPTVTATATATVLREGGRGADQYRRQNAGRQKNALGPNTHDSHLRLPVAPLHGHLERIE
jgi:hypothetical protein